MTRPLSEIDKDIVKLFTERREVLEEMDRQIPELYTVFNYETMSIDDNTFVLNPLKNRDYEFLEGYVEGLRPGILKSSLEDWLKEYKNFRCIRGRICEIIGSPVCCAHCLNLANCMENNSHICPAVEVGEVLVVTDCIVED